VGRVSDLHTPKKTRATASSVGPMLTEASRGKRAGTTPNPGRSPKQGRGESERLPVQLRRDQRAGGDANCDAGKGRAEQCRSVELAHDQQDGGGDEERDDGRDESEQPPHTWRNA
jgi:hypothetical protein